MMATSMGAPSPLTRCSSQDLIRPHQKAPSSPTPPRSNSFVASRRSGIVSEQDALRLVGAAAFDRAVDPRQPARTTNDQTVPSRWPAPVLRQQSSDRRPRPLSTGYLPPHMAETLAQQHVNGQVPQTVKADGVDTPLRLQNVALLPNRQLIHQPGI